METKRCLILVRHGQSEWNKRNLFTGWKNPDLSPEGIAEAHRAGDALKSSGYIADMAFTSGLLRAQHTCRLILQEMGLDSVETLSDSALNERDYGSLSGLNKDDARARWGEDRVRIWRRSYDTPPPGGESLRDTAGRVLPYYRHHILPVFDRCGTILVVAHGNSLRSLVMDLENLSSEEILRREISNGGSIYLFFECYESDCFTDSFIINFIYFV